MSSTRDAVPTAPVNDGCVGTPASGSKRGELRIYLGAAPGVGKTYAMLGEAHRRLERGTDLVARWSRPTAGRRPRTCSAGIEVIPPKYIEYRGSKFAELDVEAVLKRRPSGGARRRTRAHQYPGQHEPKALAGRRRTARRRHHRDLDRQRAAPRKPQRRRHPDHRHRAAGEGSRRGRPRRRSDRAGRHHAGSVAAQACPRQRIRTRTHRRCTVQLLPTRQPHRVA